MSEPPDRRRVVEEWISLADDDLSSAGALVKDGHWRQICFLSQQAAEKYLKALLTSRQISYERTHDLDRLAALLPDAQALGLLRPDMLDLSEYAVDARYPGTQAVDLDRSDADRALAAARELSRSIHKALDL